mmetsp:Transcript_108199/g.304865  ORF Transcript_108199/g.304865 Transcript_108199/m.304865 type:complete len:183 (-) Transcript_108199:67-615(-)
MGKKAGAKAKAAAPAAAEAPPQAQASAWVCADCEQENQPEDNACIACELPRPEQASGGGEGRFANYAVGCVVSAEKVAGKDRLQQLKVDIGEAEPLPIVTNAPNVKEGVRVVVAKVGAIVSEKGEDIEVKKANVGGCPSEGMICDGPMLGWTGGGAGAAALVPDTFALGSKPPETRPRMDGK